MKSFSPAGMAVKGYFGLGAKSFGNPSGAISGDGGIYNVPAVTPLTWTARTSMCCWL